MAGKVLCQITCRRGGREERVKGRLYHTHIHTYTHVYGEKTGERKQNEERDKKETIMIIHNW